MRVTRLVSSPALPVFGARLAESLRSRGAGAHAGVVQSAGVAAVVRPEVLAGAPADCLAHELSFLTGGPGNTAATSPMIGGGGPRLRRRRWRA